MAPEKRRERILYSASDDSKDSTRHVRGSSLRLKRAGFLAILVRPAQGQVHNSRIATVHAQCPGQFPAFPTSRGMGG